MSGRRTSLREQASAVERACVNQRGHVDNLRDLVLRGKRPQHELDLQAAWLLGMGDERFAGDGTVASHHIDDARRDIGLGDNEAHELE
jgi:hypothetical protein